MLPLTKQPSKEQTQTEYHNFDVGSGTNKAKLRFLVQMCPTKTKRTQNT